MNATSPVNLSDPQTRWRIKTGIVLDVLQRYGVTPYGSAGLKQADKLADAMLAALDTALSP